VTLGGQGCDPNTLEPNISPERLEIDARFQWFQWTTTRKWHMVMTTWGSNDYVTDDVK